MGYEVESEEPLSVYEMLKGYTKIIKEYNKEESEGDE